MTTELDIIDTALKVGLGALISAIATYAATNRNQKFEYKRQLIQDKKELFIEITRKIDKSSALKNEAMQSLNIKKHSTKDDNIEAEFKMLGEAANELKIAGTNSSILGETELHDLIEKLFLELNELCQYIFQKGIKYEHKKLDEFTIKRQELLGGIRKKYKESFESIHA